VETFKESLFFGGDKTLVKLLLFQKHKSATLQSYVFFSFET